MKNSKLLRFSIKAMSVLAVSPLIVSTGAEMVHADSTTNVSNSSDNNVLHIESLRNSIAPVSSNGNQTLRSIAASNNEDLSTLEQLNNNYNPDQAIKDGTQIYLLSNKTEGFNEMSRVYLSPYANVPKSIQNKFYFCYGAANRHAKNWIAYHESTYRYSASNGQYYGRFQLNRNSLNGDYSRTNQERTADNYVANRYGSWVNAKSFWQQHGWY
ncbi:aggregation-promoting factor C-terminal-like domain-containing protein [Apilactobacillus timberlakei]|uniref:Aggregation promoting factor n=1 Tax=Apilactobacillus timberlakei TaxID=2008380 RepID=A0ABY2YV36_9LACO|nr:hypothetical protein [Apilactobacillus timberlakei]TPR12214.1 hypothetical protein DY048_07970 [Apilactobacillus timberlakei]TPR12499.1 hypothetical protein DY052_09185 [Apilactobacillus timberlakei]